MGFHAPSEIAAQVEQELKDAANIDALYFRNILERIGRQLRGHGEQIGGAHLKMFAVPADQFSGQARVVLQRGGKESTLTLDAKIVGHNDDGLSEEPGHEQGLKRSARPEQEATL